MTLMNPAPRKPTRSVIRRCSSGPLAAARRLPGTDDLGDGGDEEQLAEQRLEHGQALAGVAGRNEVAVPGRRQRDEAEEEDVGDGAVAGITEERRVLDVPEEPVAERKGHAEEQVRSERPEERLDIDSLAPGHVADDRKGATT